MSVKDGVAVTLY